MYVRILENTAPPPPKKKNAKRAKSKSKKGVKIGVLSEGGRGGIFRGLGGRDQKIWLP